MCKPGSDVSYAKTAFCITVANTLIKMHDFRGAIDYIEQAHTSAYEDKLSKSIRAHLVQLLAALKDKFQAQKEIDAMLVGVPQWRLP